MIEPGDWVEIDIRPAAAKYQTQVLIEPTPSGWVLLEVMDRINYWHQNECRKMTEHEVMEMLKNVRDSSAGGHTRRAAGQDPNP